MPHFYDPLTERWREMYEAKPEPITYAEPEDVYAMAARIVRQNNIWDAVVSSAQSSQITGNVER